MANEVYIENALKVQKGVTYIGRSRPKLVNATKLYINCEVHGYREVSFRAVKKLGRLCTKCNHKSVGQFKYKVGSEISSGEDKYTIVQRDGEYLELLHNSYPERGTLITNITTFYSGNLKNPFKPINEHLPCYRGQGRYDSGNSLEVWNRWYKMFERCYNGTHKNYTGCAVDPSWWNFQNYAEWYYKNVGSLKNIDHHVDKDILFRGNRLYSPCTCTIVPAELNTLLTKRHNYRGKYPIGIYYKVKNRKFCVQCSTGGKSGKQKYLGLYEDIDSAFAVYKSFKESVIKSLAKEYKSVLPEVVYHNLLNYEVSWED